MNVRIALAALVAFTGAACGSDDVGRPASTPGATSVPAVPASAPPGETPSFSTDNAVHAGAFDALVTGPSFTRERESGASVVVLTVAPDGRIVARVGPPDSVDRGIIRLSQNDVELFEPGADAGEVLPPRPGPRPRQAVYADADDRTIVWTETTSTDLYRDGWVILAFDRAAKKTRVLAKAESDAAPAAPGGTVPFLAAGRVFWVAAESTGREGRPARAHIFSRDVAADEPARREVADAMSLTADGDTAFYVKSHFIDPAIPDDGRQIIRRLDLGTGQDTVVETLKLDDDETLTGLTASGGDVAWAISVRTQDGDPASASLTIREASGATQVITGSGVSFLGPRPDP